MKAKAAMAVLLALGFVATPAAQADLMEMTPLAYDFGEVEIGSSATTIFTITNISFFDVYVVDASVSGGSGFSVTMAPGVDDAILPGETRDIEVTFSPSVAGADSARLLMTYMNGEVGTLGASLSGVGVGSEPDPLEEIADLIDFIDISVADGTLWGDGPGNSAANRLNALKNMLEAASDLIEAGDYDQGCQQLWDVYFKVDGESPPPDFVDGPAAAELAIMVLDVIVVLGCG